MRGVVGNGTPKKEMDFYKKNVFNRLFIESNYEAR